MSERMCVRVYVRTWIRACVCVYVYTRLFSAVLKDFLLSGGISVPLTAVMLLESLLSASVCLHWWGAVVVCGVGWCVWACIVRPSLVRGGGGGAVGVRLGAWVYLCAPAKACVRTCTAAYMRTPAPKRPNLCAFLRTDAPPYACGCVRVCARQRPYIILSPSRLFLSNFFECMSEHIKKDKTFKLYVTAYNIAIRESRTVDLLKANACEILSKIGALGNRAPYD